MLNVTLWQRSTLTAVLTLCLSSPILVHAELQIRDQVKSPETDFALSELQSALANFRVDATLRILLDVDGLQSQAYRIKRTGVNQLTVAGGDPVGAMYGLRDLAEQLTFSGSREITAGNLCLQSNGNRNVPSRDFQWGFKNT